MATKSTAPRRPVYKDGAKGLDTEVLAVWASTYDVDVERDRRTDHERGDESRRQIRFVFGWEEGAETTLSMGEREWHLDATRTPATFLELDARGQARLRTWDEDVVLDLDLLACEGPALVLEAPALDGEKRLHAGELARSEPPSSRRTSRFW
jgi:hypothetical protein